MSYRFGRSRYNKELTPAGRVFMAIIGLAFAIFPFFEFNKYNNLADTGKEAEAKVISYNPTYTHNKHGTTTHHWHALFYDGTQKRVELKRPFSAGTKVFIMYDPSSPATAAEGKKGMSGPELMGSDYTMMWLMVLLGIFIAFMAFIAPSKSGTTISFNTSSSTNPIPESFSGLAENTAALPREQVNTGLSGGGGNFNTFTPAIDTAIPFVAGGPEEVQKAPAAGNVYSKFGFDVMDEGYRLFKDHAEFAAAALAEKFGHLTIGQAKEVIAKADALDYAADDEANNVQGNLYTAEKAAANLMKTHPGFSEALYSEVIKAKL
jgi:hypothetical protein